MLVATAWAGIMSGRPQKSANSGAAAGPPTRVLTWAVGASWPPEGSPPSPRLPCCRRPADRCRPRRRPGPCLRPGRHTERVRVDLSAVGVDGGLEREQVGDLPGAAPRKAEELLSRGKLARRVLAGGGEHLAPADRSDVSDGRQLRDQGTLPLAQFDDSSSIVGNEQGPVGCCRQAEDRCGEGERLGGNGGR